MGRLVILLRAVAALAGWYIARKKGYNAILWALLCGIVPPLALALPFFPAKAGDGRRCPFCSRPASRLDTVCAQCGRPLPIELAQCGRCGAYVPDRGSCSRCNAPLKRTC